MKKLFKRIGAGLTSLACALTMVTADIGSFIRADAATSPNTQEIYTPSEVVSKAGQLLGTKYVFGAKGCMNPYRQSGITYKLYDAATTRSNGVDCSGLVYWTFSQLGITTSGFAINSKTAYNNAIPFPVDTAHWYNRTGTPKFKRTIDGTAREATIKVVKENVSTKTTPYYKLSNGDIIPQGSIVIAKNTSGTDHAWIYIGQFDDRDAVVNYLKSIGVPDSYITARTVYKSGDSKHWRIEAHAGTNGGVVVNNGETGKTSGNFLANVFSLVDTTKVTVTKNADGVKATQSAKKKVNGEVRFKIKSSTTGKYVTAVSTGTLGSYIATGDNASESAATTFQLGTNGTFTLTGLSLGSYVLTESTVPAGYLKSSDLTFDLTSSKPTVSVTVDNKSANGKVTVTKTFDGVVGNRTTFSNGETWEHVRKHLYFYLGGPGNVQTTGEDGNYTFSSFIAGQPTFMNLGSDSKLVVDGLPAGTYYLYEGWQNAYRAPGNKCEDPSCKLLAKNAGIEITTGKILTFTITGDAAITRTVDNDMETFGSLLIRKNFKLAEATESTWEYDEENDMWYETSNDQEIPNTYFTNVAFSVKDANTDALLTFTKTTAEGEGNTKWKYDPTSTTTRLTLDTKAVDDATVTKTVKIVDLPEGDYIVSELGSSAFTTSVSIVGGKVHIAPDTQSTITFTNTENSGTLELVKRVVTPKVDAYGKTATVDDGTGEGTVRTYVEGITFDIRGYTSLGRYIDITTPPTDADGKLTINKFPIGNYTIYENGDSVPFGTMVADSQNITILTNSTSKKEFVNEDIKGNVLVSKTSRLYPDKRFSGAVFSLYNDVNQNGEYDEDVDTFYKHIPESGTGTGIYILRDVPYGKYQGYYLVHEDEAPANLKQDDNYYPVRIERDGETYYISNDEGGSTFINEDWFGEIVIDKQAEDGNKGGRTFIVTGTDGTRYEEQITDSTGKAVFRDLPVFDSEGQPITYVVEEINVPTRYIVPLSQRVNFSADLTKLSQTKKFENQLVKGTITINKTSEDGYNGDRTFVVWTEDEKASNYGKTYTLKTTGDGTVTSEWLPVYNMDNQKILYHIKETNIPSRYKTPAEQTTYLTKDLSTSLTFDNKPVLGSFEVHKASENEDGSFDPVAGIEFNVVVTSNIPADNKQIQKGKSWTITTDANGIAKLKDKPVYYKDANGVDQKVQYSITEVDPDVKYVIPATAVITLNADDTVNVNGEKLPFVKVDNILKKFTVELIKTDAETVTPQGDATLEGAIYGIYRDGALVETYSTDANGYFKTKEYVCGNYTVKEITPSKGYKLDETEHAVGAEAKNYTLEHNLIAMSVVEWSVKNHVSIIKTVDWGTVPSYEATEPEEGAEFQIYRKAAGSYENAKESERDTLVCDEYGFAQSKDLPYGVYIMHQTKAWEGAIKTSDWEVFISSEDAFYHWNIVNPIVRAHVKVEKRDAETGNLIPYEGAGFEIYDANGNKVVMTIPYPTVQSIDTFFTGADGTLITPEDLLYGKYTLVEVQAPYGYVLDSTPVSFEITEDTIDEENSITLVWVEKRNTAQKGKISVTKTGDIFTTVKSDGTRYTPTFASGNLSGAKFEVIAAEDIVTLDGTIRARKGDVVANLTTDSDGYAESGLLYLGKYDVIETEAPKGYLLNATAQSVELTYAGQTIEVLDTANKDFDNKYQRVEITLSKVMEKDDLFGIGTNDEYKAVRFGLYADEELTAADGEKIPKDGLISELYLNENQTATFAEKIPFGNYYVKEIATDEHYILNGEKHLVTFEYAGQDVATVTIDCGTFVNDIKRGTIRGHKLSALNGKELEGAVFGLYTTDQTVISAETAIMVAESDKNGYFEFTEVPYGKYIIHEIEAPTGYILNGAIFYATVSKNEEVVTFDLTNQPTVVEVSKIDVYGKELKGAIMQLVAEDGTVVEIWVSDGTNHVVYELPVGTYTLKETYAPDGYVIAADITFTLDEWGKVTSEDVSVSVSDDNHPIVTMVDDTTKVEFSKKSITGTNELPGAVLQVIDENGKVIDEWTSTNEVHYVEALLIAGKTYRLHEVYAPNGYVIAEDITFTVSEDGKVDKVEMIDDTTKVELSKKKLTGEEELPGATLQILDTEGNVIDTWVSTDEPHYIEALLIAGKRYILHEVIPADGYVVAEDVAFTVSTTGEIDRVVMRDDTTKVEISKKDITNEEELPGATLQVIDENGEVIDEWVSTEEAHYIEGVLIAGKTYTLYEVISPDGYVVANSIDFTVSEDGSIDHVEMFDDTTKVEISKKDITNDEELEGAELKIIDEDGNIVEEWVSTKEPHYIEGKLIVGKTYTLHEEISPDGYVVANDITFEVNEDGSVTTVEMYDDTTKVKVSKRDITTDKELPGAKLQIINADDEIVEEWISTDEEHYIEGKLIAGEEYTLHEEAAPNGYKIANDVKFTVNADGSVTSVIMYDERQPEQPNRPSTPQTGGEPIQPAMAKIELTPEKENGVSAKDIGIASILSTAAFLLVLKVLKKKED